MSRSTLSRRRAAVTSSGRRLGHGQKNVHHTAKTSVGYSSETVCDRWQQTLRSWVNGRFRHTRKHTRLRHDRVGRTQGVHDTRRAQRPVSLSAALPSPGGGHPRPWLSRRCRSASSGAASFTLNALLTELPKLALLPRQKRCRFNTEPLPPIPLW